MTMSSRRQFIQSGFAAGLGGVSSTSRVAALDRTGRGRTVHLAPDGDDSDPGTKNRPLRTLEPLATSDGGRVQDGDTVYLHGGTYRWSEQTNFDDVRNLTIGAFPNETPLVQAENISGHANSHGVIQFFDGAGCRVTGIEFANPPGPAVDFVGSAEPVVEGCRVRAAGGPGIQLNACTGGAVRDCEVFGGFGPRSEANGSSVGGDADGIQVSGSSKDPSTGTVVEYNVAHHNSDDGLDFYQSRNLVVRYNVAYANGFGMDGEPVGDAPGKGIKLGASGSTGDGGHRVHNNVAWSNGHAGIGWNGADRPVVCYNNTCVGNGRKSYIREDLHENDFAFYGADRSCEVYNNIGGSVTATSEVGDIASENVAGNSWQLDLPRVRDLFRSTERDETAVPVAPERYLAVSTDSAAVDAGVSLDANQYPGARKTLGAATDDLPYLGDRVRQATLTTSAPTARPQNAADSTDGPLPGDGTGGPGGPLTPPGRLVGLAGVALAVVGVPLAALRALRRWTDDQSADDETADADREE